MAKEPVPGRVKTRFAPEITLGEAAALYQCMIEDRINEVSMLEGMDLAIAFTPAAARTAFSSFVPSGFALFAQRGRGLGERMQNIFADSFASGYHAVTIIGSDSPDLPNQALQDAFRLLLADGTDVVLGPSHDGGYYLVGMRKPHPELFVDIPWSTDRVLQVTLKRAGGLGLKTGLLSWWNDLDTFADLVDYYARHREQEENRRWRGAKTLGFLARLNKIHQTTLL